MKSSNGGIIMLSIEWFRHRARLVAACACISAFGALPSAVLAQPAGIEPQAEKLLKNATTFLAAQKRFSVDSSSTIDVVLESGQKLQFDSGAMLLVQRPNMMRAERRGDLVDQVFYYDGKSLTLHNPGQKVFATLPAPATLEQMLDFARTTLDIVAPAGDLIYANAHEILMDGVTSGFVVGKSVVEGVRCDHLAFRGADVDWQIWIREGSQPLPCKLVITSRDVANAPQFSVVMRNWNLAPKFSAASFSFKAPKEARQIDFLPLGKSGRPTR
jgi:hypothetical protein